MAGVRSSRAEEWRGRLARFQSSGMAVAAFCGREGVSTASFYLWRKKLEGKRGGKPAGFQAVLVKPAAMPVPVMSPVPAAMIVQLPGGIRIEVPVENLDLARLVIGELRRMLPAGDAEGGVVRC
jgi:hypothetical protein